MNYLSLLLILISLTHRVQSHDPPPLQKIDLRPTSSYLGKPCNLQVYSILFNEKLAHGPVDPSGTPSDPLKLLSLLSQGQFNLTVDEKTELRQFGDFMDELCLVIDDQLTVDIHAFDCRSDLPPGAWIRESSCHCGRSMSFVDLNVPQPPPTPGGLKTYSMTLGLDRRLETVKGECVSGHKGHCNTTQMIPLTCGPNHTCQIVESQGKPFVNKNTSATYGICMLVDEPKVLKIFLNSNQSMISPSFVTYFGIILMFLVISINFLGIYTF